MIGCERPQRAKAGRRDRGSGAEEGAGPGPRAEGAVALDDRLQAALDLLEGRRLVDVAGPAHLALEVAHQRARLRDDDLTLEAHQLHVVERGTQERGAVLGAEAF